MKEKKALKRLCFKEEEKRFPWLPMLLDAYAVIDEGVSVAVNAEEKKRGLKLACKKGCNYCCGTHKDIPVYPLEMVGIYWFSIEKMDTPLRAVLKGQLLNFNKAKPCPFLIDGSCSVHPLRPIACRQFNVFNRPCGEGEDPFYTRRDDVLTPRQVYADRAFYTMLPFYGITDERAKAIAIKNKFIHTQVQVLQSCNWKELARRMDDFDFRKR